jgi:predicted SAM-dependent methyltransferase
MMTSSLKRYLKKRTPYGLREALLQLRNEWILFRRHTVGTKKVSRFLQVLPVKLNLGCGPKRKDGWVNVDLFDPSADLQLDIRNTWPFPDCSASYIYSEHVFEHFEIYVEIPHFLREALRVLEPNGVFDVVVPDTAIALRAYGDPNATFWSKALEMQWHPGCQTQLEHINYHFRQRGEHKFMWDAETLTKALEAAGFTAVAQREFNSTMDSLERVLSLYMTARKPGLTR